MRAFRLLVISLVVGCFALIPIAPAHAQYFGRNKVKYEGYDFKKIDTEHFRVYFYPEEEQAVRDLAYMAERWYERHSQIFLHQFDEDKPLIFYANDADFQQTNVINQPISPGTGGFTEPVRERVVMPLSPSYAGTNHVLGHELVHSFQYDLALNSDSLNINLGNLPLWLVEGMAEYLSVGRQDPHTAMWMRSATLADDLPSIDDLSNPREYFPYRYGQAYMAYIGGKYGDRSVANLFKRAGQIGVDEAIQELYGISADSLSTEWANAIEDAYLPLMEGRAHPDSVGREVLSRDQGAGEVNISPTLSPDGRYIAYISEQSLFSFNLYIANAETGEVIADLDRAGTTAHFNALEFLNSAGTWSPDGRRLAFVTYEDGDNQLTIWNVNDEEIERSYAVDDVGALGNPDWSPDGSKIAFSGRDGGISDLYVLDLETEAVRQLTSDRYADMQPEWSPDGETIVVTTDRGATNFQLLAPSDQMRFAFVDAETGEMQLRIPFLDAMQHNPAFAPDGRSLYFISTHDGFKDVYRMALDNGDLYRVTRLKTGVSGITSKSPAMSVASQSGDIAFSVFYDGKYSVHLLTSEEAQGEPVSRPTAATSPSGGPAPESDDAGGVGSPGEGVTAGDEGVRDDSTAQASNEPVIDPDAADSRTQNEPGTAYGSYPSAGILPPPTPQDDGLIAQYLADPRFGLPAPADSFAVEDYDPTLSLEAIAPPSIGVSTGGPLGTRVGGGVAFQFGDLLGNQKLTVALQARGSLQDIGGQVSYLNRGSQFNYGASAGHTPIIFSSGVLPVRTDAGGTIINQIVRRVLISQASLNGIYPLSPTKRFEVGVGGLRYGFDVDVNSFTQFGQRLNDDLSLDQINQAIGSNIRERDTRYFAQSTFAYVEDFSFSGLTSPIMGGRYRLQLSPVVGSESFVTALADLRRYFYTKPFTFAVQGLHIGNYGAEQSDLFGTEYIGFPYSQGFVRGYNINSFDPAECTITDANGCPELDRLVGTRIAKISAEVRLPLLGPERLAVIPFQYLPTELVAFVDGGLAWTADNAPEFRLDNDSEDRVPVFSTGVAARFNVLGALVLETYYAYPFQRPNAGMQFGLRFLPGW